MARRKSKARRKRRSQRAALIGAAGMAAAGVAALALALGMRGSPPAKAPHHRAALALAPERRAPPRREVPRAASPTPAPAAAPPVRTAEPAWLAYAVPAPAAAGRPIIAIVIDDMGVNRAMSARAVGLPAAVTLSYLPYADEVARQAAEARAGGHELLLHMPMAPVGKVADPGPEALYPSLAPAEIAHRLDWALGRFSGYVGVNNHEGSKFTADPKGMDIVLETLKRRGLLFLDSRTTAHTVAPAIARRIGLPFAQRNVFLDDVPTVEAVRRQLAELEAVARRDGAAIAIGHPKAATLDALGPWLADLSRKGFVLVPVTAVVTRNMAQARARG